jgi:hypothetical protein
MHRGLWAGICAAGLLSGPVLAQQSAAPEVPEIAATPTPSPQTLPSLPSSGETGEAAQSEPGQQAAETGQPEKKLGPTPSPETPPSLLRMALQGTPMEDVLRSQRIRIYSTPKSSPGAS